MWLTNFIFFQFEHFPVNKQQLENIYDKVFNTVTRVSKYLFCIVLTGMISNVPGTYTVHCTVYSVQ